MKSRLSGFTMIELVVVMAIIGTLIGLMLPALHRVRDRASRAACANNLKQIGLGLHGYHDSNQTLPPGGVGYGDKYPFVAWSTRILPHMDQGSLWLEAMESYKKQRNFSLPHPHPGLSRVISVYLCPADGRRSDEVGRRNITVAFTGYLGVSGSTGPRSGVLCFDSKVRLGEVADGTSNTLAVGERPPSPIKWLGWWYAGIGQNFDGSADYIMQVRETNRTPRLPTCPRGPYHFGPGSADDECDTLHFWSQHYSGANFLFCDGSVRFLRYSADPIMPALATRAGREPVTMPE